MINNKKGLSMIVSTLIIILLVLVAIGIIWTVVRNVINEGTEEIDMANKCRDVTIQATKVVCETIGSCGGDADCDCAVTLERSASGEAIDGIMLSFTSPTVIENVVLDSINTSAVLVAITNVEPLGISTINATDIVTTFGETPNNVVVTPYFNDGSGNPQPCSDSTSYAF